MNFVTGATGLVGSHLCLYLLKQNEDVTALYRTESSKLKTKKVFETYQQVSLFSKILWVQGDILDVPSLEKNIKPQMNVYHCAAKISFDTKEREHLLKVNQEGTSNMVHVSLHKQVQKFCHVSSIAALGDLVPPATEVNEETPWLSEKPHSDYALSKHGAELEVFKAHFEGLNTVILNPGVILGPCFWNEGSGVIFSKVANGISFYTKGTTGFVAITDLVKIMYQLMQTETNGDRFTCIAQNINYQNLIYSISDALNKKRPQFYVKPWMTSIAWRLDWLWSNLFFQKRQLDRATAKSLHSQELFSNQKLNELIQPQWTAIEDYIVELSQFSKLERK